MKFLAFFLIIGSFLLISVADSQIIQFSGAPLPEGGGGGQQVPVVVANQTFNISAPAQANGFVGNVSALNSPTSFSPVPTCAGCTNYFLVDNNGRMTVTATGANAIVGTISPETFSPVVNASNAAGTSPDVTVTVNAYKDPSVQAGNYNTSLPASANATIGTSTISNGGITSVAITNCQGPNACGTFFTATTAGVIKTTSAVTNTTTGMKAGTYTFTLTATNLLGRTGSALQTINAAPTNPSVVSANSFIISSPVLLTTTNIGTPITATNTPATFSVSNCGIGANPTACNGWFSIATAADGTTGQLHLTTLGVSNVNGTQDKVIYLPVVQADNGAGTVGSATQTVTAYADGFRLASACTIPRPTIISGGGYVATPPWKVAGVDYCAGIPTATTLKIPSATNLPPGCTLSGTQITCSTASAIVDGWDFTNFDVSCNASNITIRNSQFANGGAVGTTTESNATSATVTGQVGNYLVGDILSVTGGTTTQTAQFRVDSVSAPGTFVRAFGQPSVANGGRLYADAVYTVAGGTLAPGGTPTRVNVSVNTANANSIAQANIVNPGEYTVPPPAPQSLVAQGVGTGGQLNITYVAATTITAVSAVTAGHYSSIPNNPTPTTTVGRLGATLNIVWTTVTNQAGFTGNSTCTNLVFKNNDINASQFATFGQTPTITYNRIRNSTADAVQLLGGSATIRYNLFDTTATASSPPGSWISLGTGIYTLHVEFNAFYEPDGGNGDHGITLDTGTLTAANDIGYNTMIALPGANMDYMVKINVGLLNGTIDTHDNYADTRGLIGGVAAFGAPGSVTLASGLILTSEALIQLTSEITAAKLISD